MRRADRLFRIVQLLRSGRVRTAQALAERLGVCERTIYRDVCALQLAGQPIEGEAGVGYTLRRDFDLPPLLFPPEEMTALMLGARLVQAWGGAQSVTAAKNALARIEAVLPPDLAARSQNIALHAPGFVMTRAQRLLHDKLHAACLNRSVVRFTYTRLADPPEQAHARMAWPLGLLFWSGVWTLAAWDPGRQDFRSFRLDRIASLDVTAELFTPRRGQRFADLVRRERSAAAKRSSNPVPNK